MSILKIRTVGDPILEKIAKPIEQIDGSILELATNMIDTMIAGEGIGLAAPQVGHSIRMLVVDLGMITEGEIPIIFINPEILEMEDECEMDEGCLSIPDVYAVIKRPKRIKLKFLDIDGSEQILEDDEYLSRVLQHEIDHLEGKLFVGKLDKEERKQIKKKLLKIKPDGWTPKSKKSNQFKNKNRFKI